MKHVPYTEVHQVPEIWRKKWFPDGRLRVDQWNALFDKAYELAEVKALDDGSGVEVPNYAEAVRWFRESHELRNGLFVKKGGE